MKKISLSVQQNKEEAITVSVDVEEGAKAEDCYPMLLRALAAKLLANLDISDKLVNDISNNLSENNKEISGNLSETNRIASNAFEKVVGLIASLAEDNPAIDKQTEGLLKNFKIISKEADEKIN